MGDGTPIRAVAMAPPTCASRAGWPCGTVAPGERVVAMAAVPTQTDWPDLGLHVVAMLSLVRHADWH